MKQTTIHDIFFHIILMQILFYYFLIKKQSAINIFFAKKKFVKVDKWIFIEFNVLLIYSIFHKINQ